MDARRVRMRWNPRNFTRHPRRARATVFPAMRMSVRNLLLVLVAAWAPLCCCQLRAAMGSIAPHGPAGTSACCGPSAAARCCEDGAAEDAATDCCGTDREAPPVDHRCCATCKERVSTPPVPGPDFDPVDEVDVVATMLLADVAGARAREPALARLALGTGPPPRPSGRETLARHSVLVI